MRPMTKHNNILITTYFSYHDALIQTYTLPYAKIISRCIPAGSRIFLVTLDKEKITQPDLSEWGIEVISLRYQPLGVKGQMMWLTSIAKLYTLIRRRKIDTIHGWCTTGGMMACILSLLTGKPLIIDSYEPHAEAMVENGEWKKSDLAFRLLFYFEKKQTKRAKYLVANSHKMMDYAKIRLGYKGNNLLVKPACVDLQLFDLRTKDPQLLKSLDLENKIVCIYAGKLGGIYLEDEVFEFVRVCQQYWNGRFRFLFLNNSSESYLKDMITRHRIAPGVIVKRFVPHREISRYMNLADFAICPVKPVPTKRYCTPIKDGEYWASGLPVVITKGISDDSDIIAQHDIGFVLQNLQPDEYQKAISKIDRLMQTPGTREKIREVARQYRNFRIAEEVYRLIYA
jgi:glycosyltransferase involved in cell wall biosynthesis